MVKKKREESKAKKSAPILEPIPDPDPDPDITEEIVPARVGEVEAAPQASVEWCKFCNAPRLVDTKNAHWCGQCRRVPLEK